MTNLFIKQILVGPMMNYAYLVGAVDSGSVIAIDAAWNASEIISKAEKSGKSIAAVLLTHTHFDHCNAVPDLAGQKKIPVYVHEQEAGGLPRNLDIRSTKEGTVIEIAGVNVTCLHTPGHTPGSQCFLIDGSLFTGDTLFVDSCGRVDLPGSDPKMMAASLARLAGLPNDTRVFPGHDYGSSPHSTIEVQKKTNPYMLKPV